MVRHTQRLLHIRAFLAVYLCQIPITMLLPTTKAQCVAKLQEEGVNVPSEWTLLQIKAHYAEIIETQKQQGNSKMLEELVDLRRSAKKKADLQSQAMWIGAGTRSTMQKILTGRGRGWWLTPIKGTQRDLYLHQDDEGATTRHQGLQEQDFIGPQWTQLGQRPFRSRPLGERRARQGRDRESHGHSGRQEHKAQGEQDRSRDRERTLEGTTQGDAGHQCRVGASSESCEGPEGDVDHAELLPERLSRTLHNEWGIRKNLYSKTWKGLVHHGRPLLMEVACYPDSVLGTEVERRFGSGSCLRLSEWNGGNLETPEGIDLILKIKRSRPIKL